jgi:5-methylthioadenosine/S-adenosylhomocysteine deaminase
MPGGNMSTVLFQNCRFLVKSSLQDGVIESGAVLVKDQRIEFVGPADQFTVAYPNLANVETIDCSNKIVLPGLVDGHNHFGNFMFEMPNMLKNWDPSMNGIEETLLHLIWPAYAWLDEEIAYDLSLWAMMSQLKLGTTTAANAFPFPESGIRAAKELGLRMIMQPLMVTRVRLQDGLDDVEKALSSTERMIQEFHDPAGLISVACHISTSWNCTSSLARKTMELAEAYDVQFAAHLLEGPDERIRADRLWEAEGGYLRHLENLGLLQPRSVFFHCSVMNEREIAVLADKGCAIIHNPTGNAFFSGDVAHLPEMLDAGGTIGLGTDSLLNGMFHAMSGVALFHKLMPRAQRFLSPEVPFRLATEGSAAAYGMADKIGTLEAGKQADIISIDLDGNIPLFLVQKDSLFRLLSTNAAHIEVSESMIAGKLIRRAGQFTIFNEDAINARIQDRIPQFGDWYNEILATGKSHVEVVHDAFTKL